MQIFDLQLRFQEAFDLFSLFLSSAHLLSIIGYLLSRDLLPPEEINHTHQLFSGSWKGLRALRGKNGLFRKWFISSYVVAYFILIPK